MICDVSQGLAAGNVEWKILTFHINNRRLFGISLASVIKISSEIKSFSFENYRAEVREIKFK